MGIIEELKEERKPDKTSEKKLLDRLYQDCLKLIRFKNKYETTEMIYDVPVIIPGFPIYDHSNISYKLSRKLKEQGFKTIFKHPDRIYIKW